MSRFKQLESFVAVATLGSLSAAARQEGVAPAMIGRRINALESRLGIKLLIRSTRSMSLTSEGSAFLEEAQRILRELNDIESQVSQGSVRPSGHLRITAPAGFGRRHVAPLLPDFVNTYPDVSVSLDLSDRLVDLVDEGYDCAIRIGELEDSRLIGMRLADNKRVIVAAPAYLQLHGRPNVPDDLLEHNCLSFGQQGNQAKGWLLRQNGQTKAVRVKGNLACSDGSVLHQWTLAGIGLAWRSLWEVQQDIAAGRLVTVLEAFEAPANGIFALFPERKHVPQRLRLFLDFLKAQYASPTYWEAHSGDASP